MKMVNTVLEHCRIHLSESLVLPDNTLFHQRSLNKHVSIAKQARTVRTLFQNQIWIPLLIHSLRIARWVTSVTLLPLTLPSHVYQVSIWIRLKVLSKLANSVMQETIVLKKVRKQRSLAQTSCTVHWGAHNPLNVWMDKFVVYKHLCQLNFKVMMTVTLLLLF